MGELDVEAMLKRIGRDKFNRWLVAYHELHLDGSMAAAEIQATIHNEVGLALAAYTGVEFELHDAAKYLPPLELGPEEEKQLTAAEAAAQRDAEIDAQWDAVAGAYRGRGKP